MPDPPQQPYAAQGLYCSAGSLAGTGLVYPCCMQSLVPRVWVGHSATVLVLASAIDAQGWHREDKGHRLFLLLTHCPELWVVWFVGFFCWLFLSPLNSSLGGVPGSCPETPLQSLPSRSGFPPCRVLGAAGGSFQEALPASTGRATALHPTASLALQPCPTPQGQEHPSSARVAVLGMDR